MSFIFYRKSCLKGQTHPSLPILSCFLPKPSCFVMQSRCKYSLDYSPPAFSMHSCFIGILLEAGQQLVGHKCGLTRQVCLGLGTLCALEDMPQVPDLPQYDPHGRACWSWGSVDMPKMPWCHKGWILVNRSFWWNDGLWLHAPDAQGALQGNDLSMPQPSTPSPWFPQGGTQEIRQDGNNWTLAKALLRWPGARD